MFRRRRTPTDFGAEIEAHIELETERLREEGLSEEQARAAAHRTFGSRLRAEERFYESGRWLAWDHFVQDARYALRMLRKSPGFAVVAVLTVALGIGATTAIFSVVDATLLHPLPYPRPEQLVRIQADLPGVGTKDVGMSYPEIQDLASSGIFQYVSPTWYDDNNLTGSSAPARVSLLIVAPTYFALLGVKPQLGRTFDPGNHEPGFTGEVVISDGMWKRSFASDPRVLGTGVRIDTDLYRVIGVMPPAFHAPGKTTRERNIEVFAATTFYGPPLLDHPPRKGRNLPTAIARLSPGLTIAAAQSRLDALVASLEKEFPEDYPAQSAWTLRLAPLKEGIVGNIRQPLLLLLGAVGLVLLIGCVNVANLLLARSSARGREMAIRQSLGAARARLMRQLLTESLCLSVLGGVAGLGVLFCAKGFLTRLIPESLPRLNEIAVNRGVLLFAVAASVAAGALFGLAPALQAGRLKLISNLKREGRGSSGSREQARTRRVLIVTEFALSLVLLAAASLLLRSFRDLVNVRLGFEPDRVMTVRTRFPYPNDVKIDAYATIAQEARFTKELIRRTRRLPGVEEAALGDVGAVPLAHDRDNQTPPVSLILEGHAPAGANDFPLVDSAFVTPEYFRLLRVTLLRGRLLTDFDTEEAPPVAVINEAMAKTYWPNADPLGKHLKLDWRSPSWATVVGVVADARAESMENAAIPLIYTSMYQKVEHRVPHHLAIFLRGNLDPAAITSQVRREVQAIDPGLPVFGEQKLGETVAAALAARRFAMEMVGLFALTALLLAAIGIYGVISFVVSERAHEIGVRLALGAGNRDIRRMVLRQGLGLALAGAAVGLPCALVASHLMAGLLFGVRPTDVPTFAAVAIVLIGVALLASAVPARRATRIDPMRLLRDA
jgi:putative ABC transport system permease protein